MGAAGQTVGGGSAFRLPLRRRLRDPRQLVWLSLDLLIVAWLCWLFDALNNLAPVRQGLAERNGRSVLDLERTLHLDPERALDRSLARHHLLSEIVVFWYENVHIVVTLVVFALLWWRRADALGVLRATLVVVNLIALAVFWSFPVAPPRMLSGAYVDLVARVNELPVWQIGATALHSNQLCSMPSLHIAWATWSAIGVWWLTRRRPLRALACVYPLLTTYAVMATGNHYLLDAAAGAGTTLAVYWLLNRPVVGRLLTAALAAATPKRGARRTASV
ncbi:MAG TPA: phosphatase PAP2 family protein [Solirubrobacteraceae bacterium]|nr:phosphatase PAP2 family protein [Solirubrobacteraceae bacterium]